MKYSREPNSELKTDTCYCKYGSSRGHPFWPGECADYEPTPEPDDFNEPY